MRLAGKVAIATGGGSGIGRAGAMALAGEGAKVVVSDTPINAVIWQSEPMKNAFAKGHATGLQTPEEIAEVVVFLASDAARSLTGAVINCDRGWTAFKQPGLLR